jgi:protein O-mannosyl-transferase
MSNAKSTTRCRITFAITVLLVSNYTCVIAHPAVSAQQSAASGVRIAVSGERLAASGLRKVEFELEACRLGLYNARNVKQGSHPTGKAAPGSGVSPFGAARWPIAASGPARLWILIVVLLLAGAVYVPTLKYGFVWDDRALIVENKDLDTANPRAFFGQSFTHFWARQGLVPNGYYRPLVITSFWLDRKLFGAGPMAFHLPNVLWNAGTGLLVALLLIELIGGFWPGMLGGLIFALHPMHVESVAFVSDRTDLMMTAFLLLAFLAIVRYRKRPATSWLVATVLFYGLSLLCKEAAILFPVLVFMVLNRRPGIQNPESRIRNRVLLGLLVGTAAVYLIARSLVLKGASAGWGDITIVKRVLLVVNAFGRYVFLSFIPFWHRLTYPDLTRFASFGWPTVVGTISLVGLVWLIWRYRTSPRGVGAAWFLLIMLPASDFFPPGPSYLSERLLYLPTAGIVIAAVAFLHLVRRPLLRRVIGIATVVLAIAMGGNVLARLPVWKDEVALHTTMVRENPTDGPAHSNLARSLKETGDLTAALPEYRRAAELQPQSSDVQFDLGEALKASGDLKGAATAYRKAATLNPKSADLQTTLGNILIELGDNQGSVAAYRQTAVLDPGKPMAHNNLGVALQQAGDAAGAEVEFRQALSLQPDLALALNNLGEIVLARNRLDSAEQLFRHAVSAQPGYTLAHYNLGLVLQRTGRVAEAESEYRRALELMPGFTDAQERLKEIRLKQ